jgi:hypothetical protein
MSPYWVFVSKPTKRVLMHKTTCGACKGGLGMHGHQQDEVEWKGFPTRTDAWAYATTYAARLGVSAKACGLCKP